ncbi:family 16 glycosylhydrolase [Erythrobacter sp. HKB08]|uniref:glycoside hydrolase family 16 protein n=1 Tax=Erythrobacter sp. HKB08 TaxID=2502843 RepID=UPI001008F76B|nr:glycoside hydrolase family 16 protein [Erythrobacter sp. HKB08]
MRKSLVVAVAAVLSLQGCGGENTAPPAASTTTAPATSAERQLLFSDEFNSGSLDRSKWNVIGMDFWVNNEQQAYLDSPDTIQFASSAQGADGGVLILRPVYRPGVDTRADRNADFISGRINSKGNFDFTHGRAEARIRMPDARGAWPAFWLLGNGQWPDTGEIDIMEYVGEKDWTAMAVHGPGYSGETPIVGRRYFPEGQDATGWHTYAVEWTDQKMSFEVDGDTFYEVTRAEIEQYGPWRFDTPKFLILNFALGGAYPYKVNKIEEPYNGMPQSTVDAIKRGELVMEIDWVRVYGPEG